METTKIVTRMPREVARGLKVEAALQERPMYLIIVELVSSYLEDRARERRQAESHES